MSWSGTVRCSHCYKKGHNRRGCPTLKKYIEEHPDSYTARTFKERAMFARVRKCRYCEEEGHNRRTCRDLKNDKEYYRALCVSMRREVLEWLQKNGVGVGALVAYARYGDTPEHVGLVKGAQLSWITPHRADHTLASDNPTALHPFLSKCQVISVANAKYLGEPRFIAALKVLSPVAFNVAKFDLPDGWADGLDKATLEARDDHFKQSGRWRVRKYTLRMPTTDG